MDFFRNNSTALLGILVTVIVVIGYFLFFKGDTSSEQSGLQVTRPAGGGEIGVSRNLLTILLELRSISLDEKFFSDPLFRSLRDFGVELAPQPVGRPNPFAPLGRDVRPTSGTTTPAKTL